MEDNMPVVEPLYVIIDNQTKSRVGKPLARKAAYRKADRLDLEHGAIRYTVRPVKESVNLAAKPKPTIDTSTMQTNKPLDKKSKIPIVPVEESETKLTFKKFLMERFDEYPDDVQDEQAPAQEEKVQVQPEIKADIVDILRGHKANARNEVMYGILKGENEKDSFYRYFNRLNQKYGMDAIKNSRLFRNAFTIFFHTPNVKHGFFLEVNVRFTDPMVARSVFEELTSKFKKQI